MTRSVVQVRLSADEKELWQRYAGGNISKWLRRLAQEEIALQDAEANVSSAKKSERQRIVEKARPQGGCTHPNVRKGNFCYMCGART